MTWPLLIEFGFMGGAAVHGTHHFESAMLLHPGAKAALSTP
jgi:hypothetical protein